MLLSEVTNPTRIAPVEAPVSGYHGPRKTILDHRRRSGPSRPAARSAGAARLHPAQRADGPACLALAQHCRPDLFLLDISMPGMDGWTVAETLRANGHHQARILMVSASALEAHGTPLAQPFHDGYLMKPIDIPRLLETIRQLLKIEWTTRPTRSSCRAGGRRRGSRPPVEACRGADRARPDRLRQGIQFKLDEIGSEHPEHADFVAQMRALIDRFDLDQYMATLKTLHAYDH